MFDKSNNLAGDPELEQSVDSAITGEPAEPVAVDEISDEDIHTMPSKYLKSAPLPKKKGRISWIILASIIFVVLALAIVAAVMFFFKEKPAPVEQQNPIINLPVEEPQAPQEPVEQAPDLSTPSLRDQKRLADIFELRSALELYFTDNSAYPDGLSALVSSYLNELPTNPTPGGETYNYFVATDQKDYQLTFAIEAESNSGNLKLSQGKYKAGPQGIVPYSDEAETTPPGTPSSFTPPAMGLDSDQDQLSDIEENLYQTDSTLADSDNDGYKDAQEVINLFHPALPGAARLFDSELVTNYKNNDYNYQVLYPSSWLVRSLTSENSEVIFTSSNGEFFEVIVQRNPLGQSALNWYINQNPGIDTSGFTTLLVDGLPAIQTPDGLIVYFAAGSSIYTVSYNIGASGQTYFLTTYKMFLNSFQFSSAPVGETGTSTPAT